MKGGNTKKTIIGGAQLCLTHWTLPSANLQQIFKQKEKFPTKIKGVWKFCYKLFRNVKGAKTMPEWHPYDLLLCSLRHGPDNQAIITG